MRADPKTFPEFYPNKHVKPWTPPRLSATWKPPAVIGDVWPENDYPAEESATRLVPIFSPRAVEGMREFLEPNGEILPVRTPLGTYYAYNVTRVVDALDKQQCDIEYFPMVEGPRTSWKSIVTRSGRNSLKG